jgi:hypothetical protein
MANKLPVRKLLRRMRMAQETVPAGSWTHKKSQKRYTVLHMRPLEERTLRPIVLYYENMVPIVWARLEEDFLQSFEKHRD